MTLNIVCFARIKVTTFTYFHSMQGQVDDRKHNKKVYLEIKDINNGINIYMHLFPHFEWRSRIKSCSSRVRFPRLTSGFR